MSDAAERHAHPVFAWFYDHFGGVTDRGWLGEQRAALLAGVGGVVVEIGAGTGLNLSHYPHGVTDLHLVEPDPSMRRRLSERIPSGTTVHAAAAESLPLPDRSVDAVVSTFTLCSVQDPAASLAEAIRVLRPGGRLLLLEHVLAESPREAGWQRRLDRPWSFVGAGCHLTRDTLSTTATAGFDVSGVARVRAPVGPLVSEMIVGGAVAPAQRSSPNR